MSPCATASTPLLLSPSSQTIRPIGMSQAITFQVARELLERLLQPGELRARR